MSVFIIAEVGPNHNGDVKLALELTGRLAEIGVDAVKFQIGRPELSLSLDAFKAGYQVENDNAEDIFEAVRRRQLSHDEHRQVLQACRRAGVEYMCSAFDMESLEFLDRDLDLARFKVPSGEILSTDMLSYMAARRKPVILSTGMASSQEIDDALDLLTSQGERDITLLHCISAYPAPLESVHLRSMVGLGEATGYPVGFSDHTLGTDAAVAAVALGARVIEKHVTPDRTLPGPDHKASATVEEFRVLVDRIRNVEKVLGSRDRVFSPAELEIARVARKSIVAARDLEPGGRLSAEDLCFRRPGTGLPPARRDSLLGLRVVRPIQANRVIRKEDLAWE